ncbi:hypothetical protein P153DRAFT_417098 [Dothidotthia symphoricarpi CBS 119687]|uniref:Uncharacterized protein n=1 Tax=Dothidotthia symphoricarpi CBS 119687 TaxID=1392245 RepID=A0A6A6AGG9_9PLEO|nr:uncharacterized protein P153DRAFT_417098 [Dothidotthia symphoricarpi CBS 119687]KAF2130890.1 hypothetical protein P153DRAFT_417098 [Dothidotthia symphoricarpi CBS 119687]
MVLTSNCRISLIAPESYASLICCVSIRLYHPPTETTRPLIRRVLYYRISSDYSQFSCRVGSVITAART